MIIRILSSCSKVAFITAVNRRQFTVHGSQPTFLDFDSCFLSSL
jgi:hypothetical protein